MKNKVLLIATFLLVSFGATATTTNTPMNRYYNDYGETFTFVEEGITFSVFQNGEFDFYINPRKGVHIGYSDRNTNISFNSGYDYDAYIQYDDYGAIIQIENVAIYYDYYGRVTDIGRIDINYGFGRLSRVGGLFVNYDRYGYYSHCTGYINIYNRSYVYHPYHNFFVRPIFDFRIVSYQPYRNRYNPVRYNYYRDHSRNKFYKNNRKHYKYSKRDGRSSRQRLATHQVPKRQKDKIARIDRSNSRLNSATRRNNGVRGNNRGNSANNGNNGVRGNNRGNSANNGNNGVRRNNRGNSANNGNNGVRGNNRGNSANNGNNGVRGNNRGNSANNGNNGVRGNNRGNSANNGNNGVRGNNRGNSANNGNSGVRGNNRSTGRNNTGTTGNNSRNRRTTTTGTRSTSRGTTIRNRGSDKRSTVQQKRSTVRSGSNRQANVRKSSGTTKVRKPVKTKSRTSTVRTGTRKPVKKTTSRTNSRKRRG